MTGGGRFQNNTGDTFDSLAEWEQVAGPTHAYQWAEGRSAAELARAWAEGNAERDVEHLLSIVPALGDLRLRSRTAEKQTYFDDVPGGPRHHDLLLRGRAASGPVVIGVEAKADEPFDDTLSERSRKALVGSPNSRLPERVDFLTRTLVGRRFTDDASLGDLRYQLFPALAGTIVEARAEEPGEASTAAAVLLVHEFRTARTTSNALQRNARDLEAFVASVAPRAPRATHQDSWIVGPFDVECDHHLWPASQSTYIAKLVTVVAPGPTP